MLHRSTILIVPVVALPAGLLASPTAAADDTNRTFYDAMGRTTGTATRLPDGRVEFRDAQGRLTGTSNK
jgi:hypothetical protein